MNLHDEAQRCCRALRRCQCRSGWTYWNASQYALLIHSSLLLPSHSHSAAVDIKANETEANGVNGNVNGDANRIPARSFENKHRGTSSSSILLIPAEDIKADITSAEALLINPHGHGMSSSSLLLLISFPPNLSCGDIKANATGAAGVKPAQVATVSITKRGTSAAL